MTTKTITMVIGNIAESFRLSNVIYDHLDFFNGLGYRVIFWKGNKPKVAITSYPIQHLDYFQSCLGLNDVEVFSPVNPSYSLCKDILNDPFLFDRIIYACEDANLVEIIPYGNTREFFNLVSKLTSVLGAKNKKIILPESTFDNDKLWLWNYFDTKIGFRQLINEWLGGKINIMGIRFPEGYTGNDAYQTATIVKWFKMDKRDCICKSSIGVFGLGKLTFSSNDPDETIESLVERIEINFPKGLFPVIIEEYVNPKYSPSSEVFVPYVNEGAPYITYNCEQLFSKDGLFNGIIIGKTVLPEKINKVISKCALIVAGQLQALGYIGVFDLDFIVDANEQIYLLEANLRRTGGTHVHELAKYLIDSDYQEDYYVKSLNNFPLSRSYSWNELIKYINDNHISILNNKNGVVITKVGFPPSELGFIAFAQTKNKLDEMCNSLMRL